MEEYILSMKYNPLVPIEARDIKPEVFVGKKISDISNIEIYEGSHVIRLKDLFDIEGPEEAPDNPNNIKIILMGEGTSKIRMLGFKMSAGEIEVNGDIGYLTGYKMKGGKIHIHGNARGWVGGKMKDGFIEIDGDAGDFVGGKFMGEKPGKGMKGGKILIHGNAGTNVGAGMKKGTIIIEGNVGNLVGAYMAGGTIIVYGSAGSFAGARMTSGKILLAGKVGGILPSFYVDALLPKAKAKGIKFEKPFMLFIGDTLVNGMGLLHISYQENTEFLGKYERLIKEVIID
jgi:formylmethanofuran dehydrogenase subunit C